MQDNTYPFALEVGTRLNNDTYEIVKVLGQGGFGITYEAKDLNLDRHLAIKEFFVGNACQRGQDGKTVEVPLKTTKDLFDRQLKKFQGEAKILAKLQNKHLVTIYHFFKENGTSYFVMDYVRGKSLRDLIAEVHHLDEYTVKNLFLEQMLETLECIHKQNPPLCHLDIKPENIMVDMEENNIILIDFGASKYTNVTGGRSRLSSMVVYSPGYAPIEQTSSDLNSIGPWCDFYALGATMFTMLTGYDPFEPSEIMNDHSPKKEMTIPLPPALTEQMKELVIWMMNPLKDKRPHSVEEIRDFLGDQLSPEAMFNKGEDYYDGKNGCEQDDAKAVKWYVKAADKGNADAQNSLGFMYRNGRGGLAKDDVKAAEWYRKAAEQGHSEAQNNLGFMYEYGYGVEQSYKEASKWYEKSEKQGNASAQFNLAIIYYEGKGVKKNMQKAKDLFLKAAENGHSGAQYYLGKMNAAGQGGAKDLAEAFKLFRNAAEHGHVFAQYELALMYKEGKVTDVDDEEAFKWFQNAAEQGHCNSQYELALMYRDAIGTDKNEKEAAGWFRKAAEQDHVQAQCELGKMYAEGKGVNKDVQLAKSWLEKSAGQGNEAAKRLLGLPPFVVRKKVFLYYEGPDAFYQLNEEGDENKYTRLGYKCELVENKTVFGRKARTALAPIQLEDRSKEKFMSRDQVEFHVTYVDNQPKVTVMSLKKDNLVRINGKPSPKDVETEIHNGDKLTMGNKTITLKIE